MIDKQPRIDFHFMVINPSLTHRRALKNFIASLFKKERTKVLELNYIFCSDEYLLDINRRFLNHDFYTDIVSFNLAEGAQPIQGEVYISIIRVRENAIKYGVSFAEELNRVVFHGALHLCGYQDKTKKDAKLMRNKEDFYLDQYKRAIS